MKKNKNLCGITALAAVIMFTVLSLTGCENQSVPPPSGDDAGAKGKFNGSRYVALPNTAIGMLELSIPIHTMDWIITISI